MKIEIIVKRDTEYGIDGIYRVEVGSSVYYISENFRDGLFGLIQPEKVTDITSNLQEVISILKEKGNLEGHDLSWQ